MLIALDIRDVVLIEALRLDFPPGLGVLTGETGAGKSILLDSLGLALGARGDAGLVRAGAAFASVTATFDIAADHPARALLAANDLDGEPGEPLILRRRIAADGGRAFVNDQPVSVALLRDLGSRLVEVHGQADDRGLLNPRGHRDLLDAFGGLAPQVAATATAHAAWRTAEAALADAAAAVDAGQRDRDWLDHAVAELTALAPVAGEEADLAAARATMQKGARLAGDLGDGDRAPARLRRRTRRAAAGGAAPRPTRARAPATRRRARQPRSRGDRGERGRGRARRRGGRAQLRPGRARHD